VHISKTAASVANSESRSDAVKGIANLRVVSTKTPTAGAHLVAEWKPKRLDTRGFPDQPVGQGVPPSTIANVEHMLTQNGIVARYNVINKKSEVVIPGLAGVLDNADSVSLSHIKSLLALHGMQTGEVRGIIEAIANQNSYNPVADWIGSRAWDGVDRLEDIYDTLQTVADYPQYLKKAIMYCWLLSAVAAALKPSGFSTRLVLTIQGPQSIGKTRWCLSLVPDPTLRAAVVKTDHHFDGGNKDNVITATRFWIVELGELESSFRKDVERLKGIITRDRDIVRVPYASADSEFPRRTVFVATANGSDLLSDASGSSRWGVIAVESVDYKHDVDMQQLFAQLAVDYHNGKQWWFDAQQEAALEEWNERYQSTSFIRDRINDVVDFDGGDTREKVWLTASEILRVADIDHPTQQQARECGGILRSTFGAPAKKRGIMKWLVPLRSSAMSENLPSNTIKADDRDKFD
jgi:predicted P-loop ATPase